MHVTIKKWGNSMGMVIPGTVVKELNLSAGQNMEVNVKENQIILTPLKRHYSLDALLAQCDINAPALSEDDIWGKSGPQGDEVW
ncbi:AbrB/MazE/SpoVT family DNA-binding domain-containing protein [Pseudocitrobacter cyperus]|uniref:AbrB/MazE/SpoVT family DNA-binding domain-containing protein n=1 Tax=Pseudocitrobacter cyperus TaxID=3112843 RepID=A0ABV0HQK6_9ENTR